MRYLLLVVILWGLIPSLSVAQDTGWGAGILVRANVFGPKEQEAAIDTRGVVQLTAIRDTEIRPVVETHIGFPLRGGVDVGPFVAAALGGDKIIHAIGGGLLVTMQKKFSIGLGGWVQPGGKVLRGDFQVGQPAPPGATAVAYVERPIVSFAVLLGIPLPQ